jgi:hypothetical protein
MKRRNAGSKKQCLIFTDGSSKEVADRLSKLVRPHAALDPNITYFPKGEIFPAEAKLGETVGLVLDEKRREIVTDWWLAVRQHDGARANTPNWDIASSCMIGPRPGLILVEAKAHRGELDEGGKPESGNTENDASIRTAIGEANEALEGILPGWGLTAESHYQLCNRFAWGWKVASLGVPVILVYLGFLNVNDMPRRRLLKTDGEWTEAVYKYAEGSVPSGIWNQKTLDINGTPLIPLIRSWPAA